MSTPRLAITLYSVRTLDDPIVEVLDRVADAGYDGVQFAGPYTPIQADMDPSGVADALAARDLEATAPHVAIETLRDDLDTVLAAYDPFDIDGVVVPWLDESRFQSATAVDEVATELNELGTLLADEGWDLQYHNHAHEYVDLGDGSAFDRFCRQSSIGIELDVGWALSGGDDPAARLRSLGDRVSQVHLKDLVTSADPEFVEIGEGDVDMRACVDAARAIDADWLIYEHDEPDEPATTIDYGGTFLDRL